MTDGWTSRFIRRPNKVERLKAAVAAFEVMYAESPTIEVIDAAIDLVHFWNTSAHRPHPGFTYAQ